MTTGLLTGIYEGEYFLEQEFDSDGSVSFRTYEIFDGINSDGITDYFSYTFYLYDNGLPWLEWTEVDIDGDWETDWSIEIFYTYNEDGLLIEAEQTKLDEDWFTTEVLTTTHTYNSNGLVGTTIIESDEWADGYVEETTNISTSYDGNEVSNVYTSVMDDIGFTTFWSNEDSYSITRNGFGHLLNKTVDYDDSKGTDNGVRNYIYTHMYTTESCH